MELIAVLMTPARAAAKPVVVVEPTSVAIWMPVVYRSDKDLLDLLSVCGRRYNVLAINFLIMSSS
jgi:hypothetical protein